MRYLRMMTLALAPALLLAQAPTTPPGTTAAPTRETVIFQAHMSPSAETPPIAGEDAFGEATMIFHLTRNEAGQLTRAIADFNVDYRLMEAVNLTGLHIHRGGAGVAGPVLVSSGLTTTPGVAGGGSIFRANVIEAANTLEVIEDILRNPGNYYVNLHTTTYPGGVIRGQLHRAGATQSMDVMNELVRIRTLVELMAVRAGIIPPAAR